jgi:hypothetical protein
MRLLLLALVLFLYAVPTVPDICELTAEHCTASVPGATDLTPAQEAGHGLGDHPDDGLPPAGAPGAKLAEHTHAIREAPPPARVAPEALFRPPRPARIPATSS